MLACAFAAAACGSTGAERAPQPPANPAAAQRIELLKSLEGDWVAQGGEAAGAHMSYRTTAGDSAVVERIFEGTPHEMVTVYHMDGPDLVMTHYCVMGNQPHMRAAAAEDGHTIPFTCYELTNAPSHDAPHMHSGKIQVGAGTIHGEWAMLKDGELQPPVQFDLVRAAK